MRLGRLKLKISFMNLYRSDLSSLRSHLYRQQRTNNPSSCALSSDDTSRNCNTVFTTVILEASAESADQDDDEINRVFRNLILTRPNLRVSHSRTEICQEDRLTQQKEDLPWSDQAVVQACTCQAITHKPVLLKDLVRV
ncbi:hypothetical protein RRG08_024270 [Elysia crispata]|uniref:Uncharacterized protein n=1 Tax=Elysia crispata TaxID=231223 RepID=A0AAE0Z251_9GAST|nr:hypothetical protein RRG08_024270 [Elysia crispata]